MTVRCRTVRCCSSLSTPRTCTTSITIRCGVTWILPPGRSRIHISGRGLSSVESITIHASGTPIICQILDHTCQFLLENLDALLHNRIWLKSTGSFYVEIKFSGYCIIVEGFAILCRFFPCSIAARWPGSSQYTPRLEFHRGHTIPPRHLTQTIDLCAAIYYEDHIQSRRPLSVPILHAP